MPSFIIIFLSRDTALSGFSFRRIFTVNMVLFLVDVCGDVQLPCSSSLPFKLYTSIVPRPVKFVKWSVLWGVAACGALVCVRWGMDVGELRGGGLR